MVNNAINLSLFRAQIIITIGVNAHLVGRFAGVLGDGFIESFAPTENFLGLNRNVRGLTTRPTRGLMNHHATIRQSEAFPLGPSREQNRAHARRHPNAVSDNVALQKIHRIIDSHPTRDHATR